MNYLSPVGYHLKEIEALRQTAKEKYQAVIESEWLPVIAKGSKAISWWGYRTKTLKTKFKHKAVFTYRKPTNEFGESIRWDHVHDYKLLDVLTSPFEDLPTRINDPLDQEAMQALKDLLSGTRQPIPYNQALTDEYLRADRHLNHYASFVGRCNEKIEHYIVHKAYELYPKRMQYSNNLTFALTINGRTYTVIPRRSHRDGTITIYPEDVTEILTEENLINDELKHPTIHGTKSWMVEVRSRRPQKKGKAKRARVVCPAIETVG
jgi:hypothetical protein